MPEQITTTIRTRLQNLLNRTHGYLSVKLSCFPALRASQQLDQIVSHFTSSGKEYDSGLLDQIEDEHDYSEMVAMVDGQIIMVIKLCEGSGQGSNRKVIGIKCDRRVVLLRGKILNAKQKELLYDFHDKYGLNRK